MPASSTLEQNLEKLNARFQFAVFTHTRHRVFVHFYSEAFSQYYYSQGFEVDVSENQILFPEQSDRSEMSDFIRKQGELVDELVDYSKSFIIFIRPEKFATLTIRLIAHCLELDDVGESAFKTVKEPDQATIEVHDEYCTIWRDEREEYERREKRRGNSEEW